MFTCPQTGVYEFQFHCPIREKKANKNPGMDLMRNKYMVLHSFNTLQGSSIIASGNMYIKLDTGDYVYLVPSNGGNGMTKDCLFLGHLLFTE